MSKTKITRLVHVKTDGVTDCYHPGRCHMIGYEYDQPNVFTLVPQWISEQAGLRPCTNNGCRGK
jgi:hypothetical protein